MQMVNVIANIHVCEPIFKENVHLKSLNQTLMKRHITHTVAVCVCAFLSTGTYAHCQCANYVPFHPHLVRTF